MSAITISFHAISKSHDPRGKIRKCRSKFLIVTAAEVTTELKLQNRMHRLSSSFNQHESFGISFDDQNLGLSN